MLSTDDDEEMIRVRPKAKAKTKTKSKSQSTKTVAPPSSSSSSSSSSLHATYGLIIIALLSYFTYPPGLKFSALEASSATSTTLKEVWYYGWITALSTGLGVLPLLGWGDIGDFWVAVSNAIAAGMMISASCSLCYEGGYYENEVSAIHFIHFS